VRRIIDWATRGKPSTVKIPGRGDVEARPIGALEMAADDYMKKAGRPGEHRVDAFPDFDENLARRVAEAFERMEHNPADPKVRRAYEAMIDETLAQYKALENAGVDFRFLKPGEADPYARSPALGYLDMRDNGRLTVFPTDQGFGSIADIRDNPLLKRVGRVGDKPDAVANDAFRAVHDAFGHFGPGNPFFRAPGEERAFQLHSRMYSPDARPAMTTETRGQNSWVNYGPYGERNRKASGADTVYADQKIGLMPEWTMDVPPVKKAGGGPVGALASLAKPAIRKITDLFDYSRLREVPDVPQFDLERYVPPRGVPERTEALGSRKNVNRVNKVVDDGAARGGLEWYNMEPLRQRFIAELGEELGQQRFQRYIDYVAATSPKSTTPVNARNASYYYGLDVRGEPLPELIKKGNNWSPKERLPSPYGHISQGLHIQNATNVRDHGGWPVLQNPKPASFAQNLAGNQRPVTVDTHNARLWGMLDTLGRPVEKPGKTEYGFIESLQQREAARKGMSPAQYQASAWIGGGDQTGLGSPPDPMLRIFESRVNQTAKKLGISPEDALGRMIRGEISLKKRGGSVRVPPRRGTLHQVA
jgi:hypothetical protein